MPGGMQQQQPQMQMPQQMQQQQMPYANMGAQAGGGIIMGGGAGMNSNPMTGGQMGSFGNAMPMQQPATTMPQPPPQQPAPPPEPDAFASLQAFTGLGMPSSAQNPPTSAATGNPFA